MKPIRSKIALFAFAGVFATFACEQPGEQSGTDEVTTVDALAVLALTSEEIPDPFARIIRSEGLMYLCAAGESFELRVVKGRQSVGGACEAFPVESVSREGSFPYADVTIDGTAYPANELHLMRRARQWFLFIEGGHDESVSNEHYGVVFQVVGGDEIQLVSRCSGHVQANDEDSYELYQCIYEGLPSLDLALVKWAEDDSCSIDYSFCPTAPA